MPLEGGKLHSFLSGTSTPAALYADAALTTPLPNPVILDASGEAKFYYGPATYGLTLTDANDVPLWTVDPVTSTGGGGGAAGIGWGQNTITLTPAAGSAQVAGQVFPAGVLALALTVWVETPLGTSQGLTAVGIGSPTLPDAWGVLTDLTLPATRTTAGQFLSYGGQPKPTSGTVTLTAYGGLFDGTGTLYLTGHFLTCTPSTQVGMSYVPPGPTAGDPPTMPPYATEESAGLVELINGTEVLQDLPPDATRALTLARLLSRTATETRSGLTRYGSAAETTTGTLTTVATHPAGVQAALTTALDTRVPAGTALSVARYASGGVTLEPSPLTVDATGNLRLGTAVPGTSAQRVTVLTSGVAPSAAHPPDAVQLWVADVEGVAGKAGLHVRSEGGVLSRLGDGLLTRTVLQVLTTATTAAPYVATAEESGKLFLGANGSAMSQVTLPPAAPGLVVEVLAHVVQGVRVRTQAGNNIRFGATAGGMGAAIETTTVGAVMRVVALNTVTWQTMGPTTNWTQVA